MRRALGKGVVATEGSGYRLDTDVAFVDATRFLELAVQVSNAISTRSWDKAVRAADQALEMWRGKPYPELIDDDLARPTVGELTETRLQLLEMRSEALLALDRAADALPELESLTVEHPFRERLWEHLITARYPLGRPVVRYIYPGDQLTQIFQSIGY